VASRGSGASGYRFTLPGVFLCRSAGLVEKQANNEPARHRNKHARDNQQRQRSYPSALFRHCLLISRMNLSRSGFFHAVVNAVGVGEWLVDFLSDWSRKRRMDETEKAQLTPA
jgi:hypothetical protein